MFWIYLYLIFLVIFVIVSYSFYKFLFNINSYVDGENVYKTMATVLFIFITTIYFFSVLVVSSYAEERYVTFSSNKVYSLGLRTSTEGSFFLGAGSIDGVDYYYYYIKTKNGYYVLSKSEAENTHIKETNKNYRVELLKSKSYISFWHIKIGGGGRYILYVPKNTIIRKYRISL